MTNVTFIGLDQDGSKKFLSLPAPSDLAKQENGSSIGWYSASGNLGLATNQFSSVFIQSLNPQHV